MRLEDLGGYAWMLLVTAALGGVAAAQPAPGRANGPPTPGQAGGPPTAGQAGGPPVAGPAGGQGGPGGPPAPVKDPGTLAFQFAEAAGEALKNGDYDTAIELFEKANAQVPHPLFLYDIAQAHRKVAVEARGQNVERAASHRELARDYYRRFLATNPGGKEAAVAHEWLAKMDQQHAEDFPKEEAARIALEKRIHDEAVAAEQARIAEAARIQHERDALEAARIARAVGATEVKSQRRRATFVKVVGLSATGFGVVAAGVGVYFGLRAKRIGDELTASDQFDAGRIAAGEQAEQKMLIGYTAGGAFIVGGMVTYLIGHRMGHSREGRPSVSVSLLPTAHDGVALLIGGGF